MKHIAELIYKIINEEFDFKNLDIDDDYSKKLKSEITISMIEDHLLDYFKYIHDIEETDKEIIITLEHNEFWNLDVVLLYVSPKVYEFIDKFVKKYFNKYEIDEMENQIILYK